MKNEEILKKIIEKAIEEGYELGGDFYFDEERGFSSEECRADLIDLSEKAYYEVIFSHDFAKAFWGEEQGLNINSGCRHCRKIKRMSIKGDSLRKIANEVPFSHEKVNQILNEQQLFEWQHHLQQMVLEEEPLKYLSQFLDGSNDSKN